MGRLFGDKPAGQVALVDPPVSRVFAHKARVAFFATAPVVGVVTAGLMSSVLAWPLALGVGVLAGLVVGFAVAVLVRVWPVLRVLWWWSTEITAGLLVLLGLSGLARFTSPLVAALVVVPVVGVVAGVPVVRRFVVAWWWCAVVRHRLRACFAQFIRTPGKGHVASLPLILAARPTPAGERVWVWLRPGLDLTDLDGRTGKLAVACWAGEARVVRASARFAALIRVDITRRDPLARLVSSPLPTLLDGYGPAPVSPGMPPLDLGLDLDDVPEPPVEPERRRR
ncbi:hypothetical protein [Luedemannella helvata]|uniref:Uncharacterized protein n=1 Tax=Luedemannella helvata TaxID=349315 RepID=A0ABN2KVR2_9ACTN